MPEVASSRLPGIRAAVSNGRCTSSMPVTYRGPNHHQAFEDISSLSDLGRNPRPHRLTLAPAMQNTPQIPLFNENAMPAVVVAEHHNTTCPPPVCVYGLTDHELGGLGFLQRDGRVFLSSDTIPQYYFPRFQEQTHTLPKHWERTTFDPHADVWEVDFPVAVPLHSNLVYGHFLLEMFPKLHLLSRLRRAGVGFAVAVASETADWVKRIIALYFDETEIVSYDALTTRLRSPCFILPSMMSTNYHIHPDFNLAIDEISDFVLPHIPRSQVRRVWLSRSKQAGWRRIVNVDEVEAAAVDLGFDIVHPQDLSFPEQIALMSGAECVACEYGSATHNSMFARRGTKVFSVNRINWYQSGIGRLRGQPMAYFPPADGRFRDWRLQAGDDGPFKVNCSEFREQLARFVGDSID